MVASSGFQTLTPYWRSWKNTNTNYIFVAQVRNRLWKTSRLSRLRWWLPFARLSCILPSQMCSYAKGVIQFKHERNSWCSDVAVGRHRDKRVGIEQRFDSQVIHFLRVNLSLKTFTTSVSSPSSSNWDMKPMMWIMCVGNASVNNLPHLLIEVSSNDYPTRIRGWLTYANVQSGNASARS